MSHMASRFLVVPVFGLSQAASEDEEARKNALEAFRTSYRSSENSARARAVAELGWHLGERAMAVLAPLLLNE